MPGTREGAVWAVVVAGGSGTRYGGAKQFGLLAGKPVVAWAVDAARAVADGVVLVVPAALDGTVPERTPPADPATGFGADVVVEGGTTRAESVRRGLARVPGDAAFVVVHDAARPLASPALFSAVVAALLDGSGAGRLDGAARATGAVCAVPVADTLKRVARGDATVTETVDRSDLVAVQTPQAFRADALRRAHERGGEATDDAALVERLGGVVRVVPGDPRNVKLTVPADLALMEQLVARGGGRDDVVVAEP